MICPTTYRNEAVAIVSGRDPNSDISTFLVAGEGRRKLYVLEGTEGGHAAVAEFFKLEREDIVLGGFYVVNNDGLDVRGRSRDYPTRVKDPDEVVARFKPHLAEFYNVGTDRIRVEMEVPDS
jgi:hypothetical protein